MAFLHFLLFYSSIIHSVCGFSTLLHKRAAPSAFEFLNIGGVQYSAVVHVSGYDFLVILDTGSSDLWLDVTGFTLPDVQSSGVNVSLPYGDGSVAIGPISYGKVTFGNYSVENQAFAATSGSNATRGGTEQGILGVALPNLSVIANMTRETKSNGKPFITNLFQEEKNLPSFISFLLSQGDLTGITDGGIFTIGDYAEGYEAIKNAPKIPVIGSSLWVTNVDSVMVNGNAIININRSSTAAQANGKLTAALDTGSSFLFAPTDVVDAIYGNVPGAKFNTTTNVYNVPCDTKLDVSFGFGGQTFPVNPLDLITALDVQNGKPVCSGTMNSLPPTSTLPFDFLLGDSFLRNVYSLYYFGSAAREEDSAPYVQLLSVTDAKKAASEFDVQNKARLDRLVDFLQTSTSPQTGGTGPSTIVFPTGSMTSSFAQNTGSATGSRAASTIIFSPSASPSTIIFGSPMATESPITDSVTGALGDNLSQVPKDFDAIMRNSWIIIGLLGFAVLLLLVTVVVMFVRSRRPSSQQYRSIQKAMPLAHGDDPVDEPFTHAHAEQKYSEYTNPYTDNE